MTKRRRRDRTRHAASDRPPHPAADRGVVKSVAKRREALEVRIARMRRTRTWVGALGFVPLIASVMCGAGIGIFCAVPREIYLLIWAAIFGTFLGLTIRMWRERRAFEREAA